MTPYRTLHAKPCPACRRSKDPYLFCDECFGSGIVAEEEAAPNRLQLLKAAVLCLLVAGLLAYAFWWAKP